MSDITDFVESMLSTRERIEPPFELADDTPDSIRELVDYIRDVTDEFRETNDIENIRLLGGTLSAAAASLLMTHFSPAIAGITCANCTIEGSRTRWH